MSDLIEARHLSKSFGEKQVLQDLTFSLPAGEPIALIGPNGAGKTTLFSLLCGFLPPSSGELTVLGHKPGSSALFGRVSALPQDALLDPNFSLLTQLSFFGQLQGMSKTAALAESRRVLSLVDLAANAEQKATALSHGMRKRAAIAQALMGNPELVMLDEPTAGLDPVNALQVRQLIADLSGEASFIISSHNIFELERLCGTVLYLEHGRLVQQSAVHSASTQGYLTLTLEAGSYPDLLPTLRSLPGVIMVSDRQKYEYMLQFDAELAPDFDLTVLMALRQHGWRYRQLTKGQTLEQQLFAVTAKQA
jgi:ABC-2 type transport system ATP-binding protein